MRRILSPKNPTHGVEYAVLSGAIACSLVLAASLFAQDIAALYNEMTCETCVVSLERHPPEASTAAAASAEQTTRKDERRDNVRR
jgi:Flp pilus assembly pilin Flp